MDGRGYPVAAMLTMAMALSTCPNTIPPLASLTLSPKGWSSQVTKRVDESRLPPTCTYNPTDMQQDVIKDTDLWLNQNYIISAASILNHARRSKTFPPVPTLASPTVGISRHNIVTGQDFTRPYDLLRHKQEKHNVYPQGEAGYQSRLTSDRRYLNAYLSRDDIVRFLTEERALCERQQEEVGTMLRALRSLPGMAQRIPPAPPGVHLGQVDPGGNPTGSPFLPVPGNDRYHLAIGRSAYGPE